MLGDLVPAVSIHEWMGILGSINVTCVLIYIYVPDFQIELFFFTAQKASSTPDTLIG